MIWVRECLPRDIDALISIARERYGEFDEAAARREAKQMLDMPNAVILRTDDGFVAAVIAKTFYRPARCFVRFFATRRTSRWDGLKLMRALDIWRRARGAVALHFGEDTGVDLSPIAKRLGARTESPSYVIEGGPVAAGEPVPAADALSIALLRVNV